MAQRSGTPAWLCVCLCVMAFPAVIHAADRPAASMVLRPIRQARSAAQPQPNNVEQVSPSTLPACKPLDQLGVGGLVPAGELPPDLSARCFPPVFVPGTAARPWAEFSYSWEASNLYHLPAYFEDPGLERYGHTICPLVQPALSAAHFFGCVPLLPYKIGLEPPLEHVYALGYYRPGNPAPMLVYPLPFRADAAALEGGTIAGLILLIP